MVDHLFAIANEFSINLIIFFGKKSALITIELLDWMMMSLAFRKDHGCLMHQQNVSNCITFCSKSHTARMGKCLAMNFFPPRLPFHSLWNSFSNFWLHEITDPIDCYWITQIGIFSSISSGGIFVFISRLFTCKQSFFFPTKHWIQLFCCRLKRFSIVGDLSPDVCRLSHNRWIGTNSTTWKCKNSARRHTICECSKCRIVWCDFPLSSTHRHWNWLLTGDLWMFFYVLFVCVWRKCYAKWNDSSHNFMNWLWDPRRSIDDHSIILTNIFNSVEKHSIRLTIILLTNI